MITTQIILKDVPHSPSIKARIKKQIQKLLFYSNEIRHCHVVIDNESKKFSLKNMLFSVHVDVSIPGKKIVVHHHKNKDLYSAIKDVFARLEYQVKLHQGRKHIAAY